MRPFAWEKAYPPGLSWDAPIETTTLPALLDRMVAAHGAKPAIGFRDTTLAFSELGRRADRLAAGLLQRGIGRGDTVALYLPNTPYHPIAFFGVLRTGARVVHLSPLDPPRALARKLQDSGARIIVTTDLAPVLPNAIALLDAGVADALIVGADAEWGGDSAALGVPENAASLTAIAADPPACWPELTPDDVALLQYTGGTTGLPRAAMLTHANITAAVAIYEAWNSGIGRPAQAGDRTIVVLPLFHIYALSAVMLRALISGTELLLHARFDVETVLDDIERKHATAFPAVPTMVIALANHPGIEKRDLSSLRSCSSGGASMPHEVAERWTALTGIRLGGGWGMTETSPAGTSMIPGRAYGPGSIGHPLPGIEMQIVALDDPHRVLPPGETGEIRIRGPNVTTGYWNRPEETEAAFADGFFLTGDIGFMDADGAFTLVDRKKDMIICGGFNVYPRVIEDAIYEHPAVREVAVIGAADAYRGQLAKAFIVLREAAEGFTLDELRAFLADKLGRHELPGALEFRDALPRTPVGKLAKRELVESERRSEKAWI
jgi:long-chain acyl-CoA synthetase